MVEERAFSEAVHLVIRTVKLSADVVEQEKEPATHTA